MTEEKDRQIETMEAFFDDRSSGYDQHMADNVADFSEFYRAVARQIPSAASRIELLDLGCGTGLELTSIFRHSPQANITGIDLSANMLSHLREKYQDRLSQINLIQASYLDLDLGQDRFDVCVSVMTLHHLLPEQKCRLYRRILRAVKPGGLYIEGDYVVSLEEEREALAAYQEIFDSRSHHHEGHFHFDVPLSKSSQVKILQGAGFSPVEIVWEGEDAAVFSAGVEDYRSGLR